MSKHAVIVNFEYDSGGLEPIWALEERLCQVIAESGVGEYDGYDISVEKDDVNLHMYGPNAQKLFDVVRPVLQSTLFVKNASALLRYGPPEDGVKEERVFI